MAQACVLLLIGRGYLIMYMSKAYQTLKCIRDIPELNASTNISAPLIEHGIMSQTIDDCSEISNKTTIPLSIHLEHYCFEATYSNP